MIAKLKKIVYFSILSRRIQIINIFLNEFRNALLLKEAKNDVAFHERHQTRTYTPEQYIQSAQIKSTV